MIHEGAYAEDVTKPQAVITVATQNTSLHNLDTIVTKPQAVITVATVLY